MTSFYFLFFFAVLFAIHYFGCMYIIDQSMSVFSTQVVNTVSTFVLNLLQLIAFLVLFKEKKSLLLYYMVCCMSARTFFTSMNGFFLTWFDFYPFYTFMIDGFNPFSLMIYLISLITTFVIGYFLILRNQTGERIVEDKRLSSSITVIFLILNFFMIIFQANVAISSNEDKSIMISFDVAQFLFALVILILLRLLSSWAKDIKEQAALREFDANYQKQNEMLQENMEIINIKIHDLKHQLNGMMEERSVENDLQNEISSAIRLYDTKMDTGNRYVDSIFQQKALVCEVKKIDFGVMMDAKRLSFMNQSDLTTLFCNALDNAIEQEAKEEEKNRFIKVRSIEKGNILNVLIENYCSSNIQVKDDGFIQTDKSDHNEHGYGLKSMARTMEKYHGTFLFDKLEGNVFRLSFLFLLDAEEGRKSTE